MRRPLTLLLLPVLVLAACGGEPNDPAPAEGISALERAQAQPGQTKADHGAKANRKDSSTARARSQKTDRAPDPVRAAGSDRHKAPSTTGAEVTRRPPETTAARAAVPIPTGRHGYATDGRTTVSGNTRDMPETTTLTAHAPRASEQVQIRDLRDGQGYGTVTETHLLYRPEGVYLTYVKVTSNFQGGLTDVREFDLPRPQLIAPTGAAPGFERSFSMEGSGTRAVFAITAMRFDRITIGGSQARALVAGIDIRFSGSLQGRQTSTWWLWPKHGLVLREKVHTDVSNGPIRVQTDYDAVLTKLP